MPSKKLALPDEGIGNLIREIRGQKVILDSDLARVYGVEARSLNQAVARNRKRFPTDFLFQLSVDEYESIRSPHSSATRFPSPVDRSDSAAFIDIIGSRAIPHPRKEYADGSAFYNTRGGV